MRADAERTTQQQRRYEQLERRHQDRQDAYLGFERAVKKIERSAIKAQDREPSPEALGMDDWELIVVADALLSVELLGGAEAREAAVEVAATLHTYAYQFADYSAFVTARERFRIAVRADLGAELTMPDERAVQGKRQLGR